MGRMETRIKIKEVMLMEMLDLNQKMIDKVTFLTTKINFYEYFTAKDMKPTDL